MRVSYSRETAGCGEWNMEDLGMGRREIYQFLPLLSFKYYLCKCISSKNLEDFLHS